MGRNLASTRENEASCNIVRYLIVDTFKCPSVAWIPREASIRYCSNLETA